MPARLASAARIVNGIVTTVCAQSRRKSPLKIPTREKKMSSARPTTTAGNIKGDRNSADSNGLPRKAGLTKARAAKVPNAAEIRVAEKPRIRLLHRPKIKTSLPKNAAYQRNENDFGGNGARYPRASRDMETATISGPIKNTNVTASNPSAAT